MARKKAQVKDLTGRSVSAAKASSIKGGAKASAQSKLRGPLLAKKKSSARAAGLRSQG